MRTTFFKTKFYPVNYDTKEIINLPFNRERDVFIMFRGTAFIGIKGNRLNSYSCYKSFGVLKIK